MNKQISSTLTLFTAAIIWGFAFSFQCQVDTNILGNFSFNGVRFLLGSLSLVPVCLIFEREAKDIEKLKRTLFASLIAGTALFVASALQQLGISINHEAGKGGFITGLYTVLVPILGFLFFKNKTTVNTWIAALVAVCGLYLLSCGDGIKEVNIGDIVVLIGAFVWAIHILIIDKLVGGVSPLKFSLLQFAVCGLWNILFALLLEHITWSGIVATKSAILYTGIMSTGVAYTCQIIGQKNADNPNFAAIILSTECIFSAVGGAIMLGEVMSVKGYIGCALMFLGILISQMNPIKIKETEKNAAI